MKLLIILGLLLILGYCYFKSDYANTDYYKPVNKLVVTQGNRVKFHLDLRGCYLAESESQIIDPNTTPIEILQFQRDLRDGSACFKVKIGKNVGYISATVGGEFDGSTILEQGNSLFNKTRWPDN